jgi:S1-C subfamily serine protease
MLISRGIAALAACLVFAPALAETPDRSSLSFEDNTTINAACLAAHSKGESEFARCVATQLEALAQHPAPDRTALGDGRNREIARDCAYLRRVGVAEYNDCLTREMATPTLADAREDKDALASNAGLAKALTEEAGEILPVAASTVPVPKHVLPPRPDHLGRQPLSPAALYKMVERSVFVVGAARSVGDARARDIVQGSAIAIGPHLLLTNCHVVQNRPVIVLLQDHVTYRAKLIGADATEDGCVLESEGEALTPVVGIRPFKDVNVGERVFALGAPRALERTLTEGLVSALRPGNRRNMIQTSAPLSPGSSGGGLFDERGNLLGITTLASLAGSQNLNFAIAASDFWE